jgi:hypothetical protein
LAGADGAVGDVEEGGHAQADRVAPAGDEPVDLGELGFRSCEADFEALGFAEPAFSRLSKKSKPAGRGAFSPRTIKQP